MAETGSICSCKECNAKASYGTDIYADSLGVNSEFIKKAKLEAVDLSNGNAEIDIQMQDSLYYQVLSEMTGTEIASEYKLISIVREMSALKKEYEAVASAVNAVRQTGYGVITPLKRRNSDG